MCTYYINTMNLKFYIDNYVFSSINEDNYISCVKFTQVLTMVCLVVSSKLTLSL